MAGLGAAVGYFFREIDTRRAFFVGLGVPALLQIGATNFDSAKKQDAGAPAKKPSTIGWLLNALDTSIHAAENEGVAGSAKQYIVSASENQSYKTMFFIGDTGEIVTNVIDKPAVLQAVDVPSGALGFRLGVGATWSEEISIAGFRNTIPVFHLDAAVNFWSGFLKAFGFTADKWILDIEQQPIRRIGDDTFGIKNKKIEIVIDAFMLARKRKSNAVALRLWIDNGSGEKIMLSPRSFSLIADNGMRFGSETRSSLEAGEESEVARQIRILQTVRVPRFNLNKTASRMAEFSYDSPEFEAGNLVVGPGWALDGYVVFGIETNKKADTWAIAIQPMGRLEEFEVLLPLG